MSTTTEQIQYRPGDVANGYRLAEDGTTWEPIAQSETPTPGKKKRRWLKWAAIGTGGLLALSVAMNGLGGDSTTEDAVADAGVAVEASVEDTDETVVDEAATAATAEEAAPESDLSLAQENALLSAENYLATMPFSKQGLISQLSSEYGEGFELKDAEWAVNQLDVDWQEQAVRSGENYLETMPFSKQGLINQLSSENGEGFSVEDATAAVNQLDVDWNEQAVRSGENYLETMPFSRTELIDQLSSEYGEQFTIEQATYAVDTIGL